MQINIPGELSFIKIHLASSYAGNLTKLGGYTDGGYVADYRSILSSDLLISGGVGSNVRFESDFYEIKRDLKVILVDPTVSIVRMFFRSIFHFFKQDQSGFRTFSETMNYLYFRKKGTLIKKYLGASFSVSSILKQFPSTNRRSIFLKLDIEGAEYDLLDDIVVNSHLFTGICIEFHDLTELVNRDKLKFFLEQLDYRLINISINEVCITNSGFPSVLELSLCPIGIDWPEEFGSNFYLQSPNSLFNELVLFK